MRLIDADELRKAFKKHPLCNDVWLKYSRELIDNALTVEPCNDCEDRKQAEYIRHSSSWHELQALRKFKEEHDRPQGEWIPVSERLPDDMQKVLIWFEYFRYGDFNCMYQTYGFGYVLDGKWSPFINGETGWQDYNIIAWQPLPEPYKRGKEE